MSIAPFSCNELSSSAELAWRQISPIHVRDIESPKIVFTFNITIFIFLTNRTQALNVLLGTKCEQLYLIWIFTTLIIVRCLFIKFRREFWAEHFLFPNCVTKQLSKNEPFSLKILSNSLISEEYDRGVLPYIIHIGMCRPKGYGFGLLLVWKRVQILPILVWNLLWVTREST